MLSIKWIPLGFLLAVLIIQCDQESEEKLPKKTNVLFILADDLGYHDLSVTGSDYYETPHIDRIATEGIQFKQGYACSRVCSPSRASIFSGQYTARHGITDWIGAKTGEEWSQLDRATKLLPPDYVHQLPHQYTSLAETFKQAGYHTFFSGKWHLGSDGSLPQDHGFDINKGGYWSGSPRGGYFSPYNNPQISNGPPGENLSHRLGEETANFIESNKDSSFFAVMSFYAVHGPIQTTREKWSKYRAKATQGEVPDDGFKMERVLPIRLYQDNPVYAGLVEAMDESVGIVLDKLDELGLSEETIVVFTSDNGGVASGDAYATSNSPLRGGKGYQWEGGIREPYFMRGPGIKPQSSSSTPVTGADFYPTLLDMTGIPLQSNQPIDGQSLVPIFQGQALPDRDLYWHYPHYGNQGGEPSSIIRSGDWKLIHYYEDGRSELYNLANDPSEKDDASEHHPEHVQDLLQKLTTWLHSVGAKVPRPDPTYTEARGKKQYEKISSVRWPALEKQRKNFLDPDWQPNDDWWGSAVEK